jgi:hypothetical protein
MILITHGCFREAGKHWHDRCDTGGQIVSEQGRDQKGEIELMKARA